MTQQNNAIDKHLPVFVTEGGTGLTNSTDVITSFAVPQCKAKNMLIGSDFMTNPSQIIDWNGSVNISGFASFEGADRWIWSQQGSGTVNYKVRFQDAGDSPISGGYPDASGPSGWTQRVGYLELHIVTGDSILPSADYTLYSNIEGIRWKQYAQVPLVLSFWVNVPVAGTYCVGLSNYAGGAQYANAIVLEYDVISANTWQWVQIQIPPSPSTGAWSYQWGQQGVQVLFNFGGGTGTQKIGPIGQWTSYHGTHSALQTNAIVTGGYIGIGNMQIERGNYATGFGYRSADDELYLCQRFRQMSYLIGNALTHPPGTSTYDNIPGGSAAVFSNGGVNSGYINLPFPTQMCRVPPVQSPLTTLTYGSGGQRGSGNVYKADGSSAIKGVNITSPANIGLIGPHSSQSLFVQMYGDSYCYGKMHWYADARI